MPQAEAWHIIGKPMTKVILSGAWNQKKAPDAHIDIAT